MYGLRCTRCVRRDPAQGLLNEHDTVARGLEDPVRVLLVGVGGAPSSSYHEPVSVKLLVVGQGQGTFGPQPCYW